MMYDVSTVPFPDASFVKPHLAVSQVFVGKKKLFEMLKEKNKLKIFFSQQAAREKSTSAL